MREKTTPPRVKLSLNKFSRDTLKTMPSNKREYILRRLAELKENIPRQARALDLLDTFFEWEIGDHIVLFHIGETRIKCTILGISLRPRLTY